MYNLELRELTSEEEATCILARAGLNLPMLPRKREKKEKTSFVVLFYQLLNDPKPIRADGVLLVKLMTLICLSYICLIFSTSLSHCLFALPRCTCSSCQSGSRGSLIMFFLLRSTMSSADILDSKSSPKLHFTLDSLLCFFHHVGPSKDSSVSNTCIL